MAWGCALSDGREVKCRRLQATEGSILPGFSPPSKCLLRVCPVLAKRTKACAMHPAWSVSACATKGPKESLSPRAISSANVLTDQDRAPASEVALHASHLAVAASQDPPRASQESRRAKDIARCKP